MKRENEISEELVNMGSKLAFLPHKMPFAVGEDYFDNFSKAIYPSILKLDETEVTPGWSKIMPYATPDDYFADLSGHLVTQVKEVEFAMGSGNLNTLRVPEDYFKSFPEKILALAKQDNNKTGNNIKIPKRSVFSISKPWAAAAAIIITIGIGALEFFHNQSVPSDKVLATIPATEIKDYFQNTYSLNADNILREKELNSLQFENNDIIEYLDESGWN